MIKAITYAAEHPGPKFLVIGAVHGNEKCGTAAIHRVMRELDEGQVTLACGQMVFVPVGNPRAYEQDQRYVERNLNRYLVPMDKPDCYEARLGNILCPLLADCDAHLAIHSYTVGGEPFIFIAPNDERERAFAASLGARTLLTGWQEAYAATGRKTSNAGDEESTGSIEYARRHGAMAVNIECGQHKCPNAPDVAYHAIRNAMSYLGLTTEPKIEIQLAPTRLITVTHVIYRDDEGQFPKAWKHLEEVRKGKPMAFNASGQPILAPDNGFIIMPKADCPIGEEWFYFGVGEAA